MKKILISTGLFYPSKLGGPANTLYWLAKGLESKDIDVTAVSSYKYIADERIQPDKWTVINGIKALYCSEKTKFAHRVIFHSIKEVRNCDVTMLSSFHFMPCFFVGLYALFSQKKIIWSPRGELLGSAINNNKVKKLYVKLIKLVFAKPVIFHATSEEEKKVIQKYLGKKAKIVTIPNYMELPEKEKRNSDENYLLYVGRIAPIKALDNLIIGLAKSEVFVKSDYKLLVAGYNKGEYYDSLVNLITENNLSGKIVFPGNVEGKEKNRLYANAYFTFLISHSENFGNVVVESLAQGTPVVASQGTPWHSLVQNASGYWISNDAQSIAKCIDTIIQLPSNKYEIMRNSAFEFCSANFDVYKNIDQWINVLEK
jgi:glycosyltransferase involved in cell wall biosynthesis